MSQSTDQLIRTLHAALEAASEHLDYCGYGDSWERECAREAKLPEQIEAALAEAAQYFTKETPSCH